MRKTKTLAGLGLAAMGVMLTGACSDSTGPETLNDPLLLDMAVVAADATLEDIQLMSVPFGFGPSAVPGVGGAHPGQPGGKGGFSGSFSGTREVTFFDASGAVQDGYDPLTTDVIHVLHDVEGEMSREFWEASIARSRDMTISGLEGEETHRQMDGTGTEEVARSRHLEDGTERTYDMSGTFTHAAVVVPIPGSEPRWPVSGTITRNMSVKIVNGPDGDVERTVEIVITFDGDATANGSVNGESFEIDLAAREGRWPLRRRHNQGG